MAAELLVQPATGALRGSVPVPSDKSIAHRAILLAGLGRGASHVRGGGMGDDNRSTLGAFARMGVAYEESREGAEISLVVHGKGLYGLRLDDGAEPLDCGNSGTTMRLLAGVLAAQRFRAVLVGDASLSRRPMDRIARPLRLRGARIEGKIDPRRVGEITAPLVIGPLPEPHVLSELEYDSPVASAQVKSAVLLSGLYADGPTYVREPLVSRDHTERMLRALGVPVSAVANVVELDAARFSGELPAFDVTVPGDVSAAAFLMAAAFFVPGSRLDVRGVGLNPTRTGILDVARSMGARFEIAPRGESLGEPRGDLRVEHGELSATSVGGELVTRSIDEIPVLCAIAARAHGVTRITDAGELRVKESDRIAAMARVLRAFGVECEEAPDGIVIQGKPEGALRAADVESEGDHRVAMSAALLGLVADGPTRVRDADCIATSFPRFVGTLNALGARIEVSQSTERA